jgi:hypothetical protein
VAAVAAVVLAVTVLAGDVAVVVPRVASSVVALRAVSSVAVVAVVARRLRLP